MKTHEFLKPGGVSTWVIAQPVTYWITRRSPLWVPGPFSIWDNGVRLEGCDNLTKQEGFPLEYQGLGW